MSAARKGSAFPHGDHFDIQITFADGSRSNRECQPAGVTEAEARAEAKRLTALAIREGWKRERPAAPRASDGSTFDAYADKWIATRRDQREPRTHLRLYILPVLKRNAAPDGSAGVSWPDMTEITRADVERIVEDLDKRVRDGEISWKTALNAWGTVSKLFADAARSKRAELRVLERNPAADVRGPDRGDQKQSAYLFPKEATTLLACEAIPERWRTIYALAMYTGLRRGELAVLRVADVVLDAGYLSVARAHDRVTGGEKSTKGGRARRIPIEEALQPLLEKLTHGRDGAERLVVMPPKGNMASQIREHLERAGLTRAELHADDETRRPFSFHDARHTAATWWALRGEPRDAIAQYLGHAQLEMTQRYVEEARAVGRGDIGTPFPSLPQTLIPSADKRASSESVELNRSRIARISRNSMNSGGADGARTVFDPHENAGLNRSRMPRNVALEVLSDLRALSLDAGDLALAKRVHTWEGELLGEFAGAAKADVIDLVDEREKRR